MRLISFFALQVVSRLLVASTVFAQTTIHGVVTDGTDNSPITAANVYLKNHDHIGTYTGPDGTFSLQIPTYVKNDYLVISSIGYEAIDLNRLADVNGTAKVTLNRMSILLEEVIVRANQYKVEEICQRALHKISDNYPQTPHYIEGFYRKISTDSVQYTGLVEAVIGVKDPGYQRKPEDIQIGVLQSRYGDNMIKTDSISMQVGNVLSERLGVAAAKSLHRFYESNLIRLYNKPYTLFSKQGRLFEFKNNPNGISEKAEIENITIEDGDTILHIFSKSFTPERTLDAIYVSINLRDNAVVEFTRGLFEDRVTVKFKKLIDGRYYPYFIRLVSPVLFDKNKGARYYDIETFEVDLIQDNVSRKKRIAPAEDRTETFSPPNSYNSSFWRGYMATKPRRLDNDVLTSLERIRPLEVQFTTPRK